MERLTGLVTSTEQGPIPLTERALAPDLARGFMLLFIALANSHYFLRGSSVLGGYPQDGSVVDSAVTWLISTFVDARAFPMFGLLFGYGVAQIVRRHEGLGARAVRHLLWRRALFLVVVGFAHAMLLYVGDILAAYGVLLFLGVWAIRWTDGWLLLVAAAFLAAISVPGDVSLSTSAEPPDASMLPPDLLTQLAERIQVAPLIAVGGPIAFVCPFLVGLWAGRRRILERPERYRTMLRATATIGIGTAVLGAQPVSLVLAGARPVPSEETLRVLGPLHDSAGVLGGFGYAALIALMALRLGPPRGWMIGAIAAVGQRSMTCYLAQSVVWALVFTPYLLNLSDVMTVTTTALLAVSTWFATVVLADWMSRTGRRGPFELLARRVTYGWARSAR